MTVNIVEFYIVQCLFIYFIIVPNRFLIFYYSLSPFHYMFLCCCNKYHPFHYLLFISEVTVRSRAHDVQEDWKPAFLSNEEFTYLVLEALEGFVMVFSVNGRIYYVSEGITSLLGHNPVRSLYFNLLLISF